MSLINYVEPVNIAGLFIGIGSLLMAVVLAYIVLKVAKPFYNWIEGIYHHDLKYWILEEKMLDKVAKEKGIDLDEELLKREVISKPNKSFRKKIEEEVFNQMFPEEKKK